MLFFVLSGYLISNILFELKEKTQDGRMTNGQAMRSFYARRILRIFPAYYILVFFLHYINHANTREIFPWLVTYSSNLLECKEGKFIGDFNHLWSLAIEEQFYLIWPLIIIFVDRKYILKTILFVMALSVICRASCFYFIDNWFYASYFTLNLFFPLCLGALLAYAKRYSTKLAAVFGSFPLLLTSVAFYTGFHYIWKFIIRIDFANAIFDEYIFSVACAFIVYRASSGGFKTMGNFLLTNRIVIYLGKISYGIYLYHLFIVGFFWNLMSPFHIHFENKRIMWLIYLMLTIILATFSYYVIEKPFNNLKKKFKY